MNVLTKSIVIDLHELEALRRSRTPAAGSSGPRNADTTPIVVDLRELEALRRSRIPVTPAKTAPSSDFRAGTALVPGTRARLH